MDTITISVRSMFYGGWLAGLLGRDRYPPMIDTLVDKEVEAWCDGWDMWSETKDDKACLEALRMMINEGQINLEWRSRTNG